MTDTLSLLVNGAPFTLPLPTHSHASILTLLDALALPSQRGVAVALNDRVIPRSKWHEHTLAQHDRVEIIRATQGG